MKRKRKPCLTEIMPYDPVTCIELKFWSCQLHLVLLLVVSNSNIGTRHKNMLTHLYVYIITSCFTNTGQYTHSLYTLFIIKIWLESVGIVVE